MKMTQEENKQLMKIKKKVKQELKQDLYYNKLKERKDKIINYLKIMQESNEKKELINKYEKLGKQVKEIEIETAYKITIENKTEIENQSKTLLDKIKCKLSKKSKEMTEEDYNKAFNKIVEDSEYKEKLKLRNEIFKKITNANKKQKDLLYELESIETEIATIETDKVKDYLEKCSSKK